MLVHERFRAQKQPAVRQDDQGAFFLGLVYSSHWWSFIIGCVSMS